MNWLFFCVSFQIPRNGAVIQDAVFRWRPVPEGLQAVPGGLHRASVYAGLHPPSAAGHPGQVTSHGSESACDSLQGVSAWRDELGCVSGCRHPFSRFFLYCSLCGKNKRFFWGGAVWSIWLKYLIWPMEEKLQWLRIASLVSSACSAPYIKLLVRLWQMRHIRGSFKDVPVKNREFLVSELSCDKLQRVWVGAVQGHCQAAAESSLLPLKGFERLDSHCMAGVTQFPSLPLRGHRWDPY